MMRLTGLVLRAALISIGLTGIVYGLAIIFLRPLDTVEGELLFEASRLRSGFPLWVDPHVGAHEYGPVPARYYVLYTATWPALIALVPPSVAPLFSRAVATLAFYGGLLWIVLRASPERRHHAFLAAAYAGGVFMLVRAGVSGSADSLAVLLVAIALLRALTTGSLDAVAGTLFTLAAWTKPNVVGAALGAFSFTILTQRLRVRSGLLAAVGVSAAMAGIEHVASHGQWATHLFRSTAQPLDWSVWFEHVAPRFVFLGLPHLGVIAFAWHARADRSVRLALASLAASLAWTLFSMAKIGSSTNYWIEPSMVAVVVVSVLPSRKAVTFPPIAVGLAGIAALLAVLNARTLFYELPRLQTARGELGRAAQICALGPTDVAIGEHPGIEMTLNQRIVATPFQLSHTEARDLEQWKRDMHAPEVRCLIMESDLLEKPVGNVDAAHDRFSVSMREIARAEFALVDHSGSFWTYRKR